LDTRPELLCGRWDDNVLVLPVRAQARARRLALGPLVQQRIKLSLTAPPVDGKANAQARDYLAAAFGVSPSRVMLVQGENGRDKLFRIEGPRLFPAGLLRK